MCSCKLLSTRPSYDPQCPCVRYSERPSARHPASGPPLRLYSVSISSISDICNGHIHHTTQSDSFSCETLRLLSVVSIIGNPDISSHRILFQFAYKGVRL